MEKLWHEVTAKICVKCPYLEHCDGEEDCNALKALLAIVESVDELKDIA